MSCCPGMAQPAPDAAARRDRSFQDAAARGCHHQVALRIGRGFRWKAGCSRDGAQRKRLIPGSGCATDVVSTGVAAPPARRMPSAPVPENPIMSTAIAGLIRRGKMEQSYQRWMEGLRRRYSVHIDQQQMAKLMDAA